MRKKTNKVVTITFLSMLFLSLAMIPNALAPPANCVYIDPPAQTFSTKTTFTVQVRINASGLYGFDIRISWDDEYLAYVSHVTTVGVETYPGGVLHEPVMQVKDDPIGTDAWYWVFSAMLPAPAWTGDGMLAEMTFEIIKQPDPWAGEGPVTVIIDVYGYDLSDIDGNPLKPDPSAYDGEVTINPPPTEYPPEPVVKVLPEEITCYKVCDTFTVDVWILGLDPLWDVSGLDLYLGFDPALIECVGISVDPTATFVTFWPGGLFIIVSEWDNVAGWAHTAFLGLPGFDGTHDPPAGDILMVRFEFHVIFESETYPPPSCVLGLYGGGYYDKYGAFHPGVELAGFGHPERGVWPWYGNPWAVPLPHTVENATYIAHFKPPGRWIDLYTQYPDPYGGQGPNLPSDLFWPQKWVVLYAYVTYNLEPVQNKIVSFEVYDPLGRCVFYDNVRSDHMGVAVTGFRIPWPCEGAEEEVFGEWFVIATVDIACEVVTDTLRFKVNWIAELVSITSVYDEYYKGEHLQFVVLLKMKTMQMYHVVIVVVIIDELGVPLGQIIIGLDVGGMKYCETLIIELDFGCITVPKHAFVGMATAYAHGFYPDLPINGGSALCDSVSTSFGILKTP